MAMIARQFARPRGPLGRLIGRGMARRNADFSKWVVGEIRNDCPSDEEIRIDELDPGQSVSEPIELNLAAWNSAPPLGLMIRTADNVGSAEAQLIPIQR